MQQIRHLSQRDKVVLQILPGRQVTFSAPKLVGDAGELPQLLRSEQSTRNLGSDHLNPSLPLAINSAAQTERPKLIVGKLPAEVQLGLLPEQFDVLANSAIILLLSSLEVCQDCGRHKAPFSIEITIVRIDCLVPPFSWRKSIVPV